MNKMFIGILTCLLLTACSGFDDQRANEFQSLSQQQQAHYWQAKKVAALTKRVQALGLTVYTLGDENQILISSGTLFNGNTPQLNTHVNPIFKAIADLINAQSTASVQVLTYTQSSNNTQRNFSLTQSWADSVVDGLRQQGLLTGVVSAQGHGECDNIGTGSALTNRIVIRYRIDHEN